MGLKRALVRVETVEDLTEYDQQELLDDSAEIVDGRNIGGHIVANEGWTWIEFEGEESDVDYCLDELLSKSELGSYTTLSEEYPNERQLKTEWFGHYEGSADENIDF